MSNPLEKIVKTYRTLAQIPVISDAKIFANANIINATWTQRNLERGKMSNFSMNFHLDQNLKTIAKTLPIELITESLISTSPSEKFRAVLRDIDNKEKKQFLEIWDQQKLFRSVDLTALDLHGDVYSDGEFRSFDWSPDETKILYIAEQKPKKSEPFYKRKAPSKESGDSDKKDFTPGFEYEYQEDWGEQLVGKKFSTIALYDIETDSVNILEGIPEGVCPGKVIWSPDGLYVVGIALKTTPRKLGLIYCSNRESTIFRLDLHGNYSEINLINKCVKSPRFTPDGGSLIWLQRDAGGAHASCMALYKTNLPITANSQPEIIVDIVKKNLTISDEVIFYGLFNTGFPKRCWTDDGRLILTTPQKYEMKSYLVDINSKKIIEIPLSQINSSSQIVLDVKNNFILVSRRNFLKQDVLAIAKIPDNETDLWVWTELTESKFIPGLDESTFEYLNLTQVDTSDVKEFNAVYIGPKTGAEKEVPLIVWPHGGPHSVFTNNCALEISFLLNFGYALLLINYRGSLGFGEGSVNFLKGKVGSADVSDCVLATQTALAQFPWLNPNRLILTGGSHGGFLVTHLSGQYPDMFKAVVARNPVIDIASMSITSDIPDWCYVEAGVEYTQIGEPSEQLLLAMRKASPIQHAHKVKAPTMLQIGSKDLRVPPQQGLEYLHRLKANGAVVKMNLYDDNHPLGKVPNEMDNLINSLLWFEEHTKK